MKVLNEGGREVFVIKGLFRRNLEMFKYLLSVELWIYNSEEDRCLYFGYVYVCIYIFYVCKG